MAKFYVGQKVLVTGSSYYNGSDLDERGSDLIGKICKVKYDGYECDGEGGYISVFTPDERDWWFVNKSDIQPIDETPETLTVNGVEYIRKPEPEHEWKFGDWARHPKHGVVFVGNVNGPDSLWCIVNEKKDGDRGIIFHLKT